MRRGNLSRYPDDLGEQDQQTYRRWVWGLFGFYSIVLAVTVAAGLAYRPARDLTASIEGERHFTAGNTRSGAAANAGAEKK
jgi:hypothetical protein